jgi:hypothetical protein
MEGDRLAIGTVAKGKLKGQCRIGGIDRIESLRRRAAVSTHSPQGPGAAESKAGDIIGQRSYESRNARIGINSDQSPHGIGGLNDSEQRSVTGPCGQRL